MEDARTVDWEEHQAVNMNDPVRSGQRNSGTTPSERVGSTPNFRTTTSEDVVSTPNFRTGPFSDQDIRHVSDSLARSGQFGWSKVPRIYVVLQIIGHAHAIDTFIENGVTDLWFPFTEITLPLSFKDQPARKRFLDAQKNVFSDVLDFESGSKHHHFSHASNVPLTKLSELGRGHFGFVDRVRSEVSFREYARKLIPRGPNFRKNKAVLKDFENELGNLKRLSHLHIVQLSGSYTDPQFVGIIMTPVADCNLKEYFERSFEPTLLRTFFGCLAVAVRFLHQNSVRHKDIKPQNILVYKDRVLLTDFGISLDWSETGHSTTSGPTTKTPRYCAPEVANFASRNSSSDIWSLGCVFLEMWTVISGHTVEALVHHLTTSGTESSCYHLNMESVASWCTSAWKDTHETPGPLQWITSMMQLEKNDRWSAVVLADQIQSYSEEFNIGFVGYCCDATVGSPETVDPGPDVTYSSPRHIRPSEEQLEYAETETTKTDDLDVGHIQLGENSSTEPTIAPARTNKKAPRKVTPTESKITRKRARRRPLATRSQDKDQRKMTRTSKLSPRPPSLPNSYLIAQRNKFTADQVMQMLYGTNTPGAHSSRRTRASSPMGKPHFAYGDYMLPNVVYAETCVRSKASQYARWSTLRSLVQHMTPAVLRGYTRRCPDAGEGLASIPTIVPTGSNIHEVHGMLIFGWHDSHTSGRQKYESEHELEEYHTVSITLEYGWEMEIEASMMVWRRDEVHLLHEYNGVWDPSHLLREDWYLLVPESVRIEDEQMGSEIPHIADSGVDNTSSSTSTPNSGLVLRRGLFDPFNDPRFYSSPQRRGNRNLAR